MRPGRKGNRDTENILVLSDKISFIYPCRFSDFGIGGSVVGITPVHHSSSSHFQDRAS